MQEIIDGNWSCFPELRSSSNVPKGSGAAWMPITHWSPDAFMSVPGPLLHICLCPRPLHLKIFNVLFLLLSRWLLVSLFIADQPSIFIWVQGPAAFDPLARAHVSYQFWQCLPSMSSHRIYPTVYELVPVVLICELIHLVMKTILLAPSKAP